MRRPTIAALLVSFVFSLALPASAGAQAARARVRAGDVTGLEMGLEGALSAPRGGTLRWLVTAYEVLGLSNLRPAAGITIHLATSLEQVEDAAVLQTDALGRATVELPIPADAPGSFRAVLRLVNEAGIQRRFELTVAVRSELLVEAHFARSMVSPGGPARVFGRVSRRDSGLPHADAPVRLTLRDAQGRPLAAPQELRTDAAGLFAHTFRVPRELRGGLRLEARAGTDEHPVTAQAGSTVAEPAAEAVLVAVAPGRSLVAPGARVALDIVVRTSNGRPVEGATVTLDGADRTDRERRTRTDGRGRAQLAWTAPSYSGGVHDVAVRVTASREGVGTASGAASVRVTAQEHAAGIAVEGGALSPELGGRVWVRVVGPDGRPAGAGVPVRLDGPRLPGAGSLGITDDDGVAAIDVTLGPAQGTGDRCGGQSATALEVRVGTATLLSPCLPLDPDAALRVRVARPLLISGRPLEVTIERVRAAARAPVEVSVLGAEAAAIVSITIQPGEQRAALDLPADVTGVLWVRARALIGSTRETVRGGTAGVWVAPGAPLIARAALSRDGTVAVRFEGPADEAPHAYVVAAPIDQARQLAASLRPRTQGPFGELRRDPAASGDALLFAALAVQVPADAAAPAVLRDGRVVAVPAPSEPASIGLLRDPARARARFVTGRLALIFHALEAYVSAALPERIEDVAVQSARGYELNGQILESVAASGSLGAAGATGLGGEPLTIEELRRFDPSLTYDNVARRITRERLFRLLLALRTFVQAHGFDLPWSRLGDPSTWMRQLVGQHVAGVGSIDRRQLVDGWGRPFRLQPARGGRSRFTFVDPLGAWELVSAGANGRFGDGDDQWDPTARVLRSGTPYAEAVGEDLLVARLEGVELGRASLELLTGAEPSVAQVGALPYQSDAPGRQLAQQMWTASLPAVLEVDAEPLALRRPAHPGEGAGGQLARLPREGGSVELELDEEPRTWGVVVYAWTPQGWGSVDVASALGGAPLIVEGAAPRRLRAGEPVTLDLVVTNVAEAPARLVIEASGRGVDVEAPSELLVGAGEAAPVRVGLSPAGAPGPGSVALSIRGEAAARSLRWRTEIVTGDHPLRLRAAGLARSRPFLSALAIPADASRIAGRVVLLAPSALASDPDLADLRRRDPALVAWSDALAGRRSDPGLAARLLLSQQPDGSVDGADPWLSSACAAVAWAGAGEHDADARAALARLHVGFAQMGDMSGQSADPDTVRRGAAALAALAAGGVPELDAAQRQADPVLRAAAAARVVLRRTLRQHPEEPSLLARAAAALLLADPRDAYGIAMLERAAAHLADAPDGGAMVRPSAAMDEPLEALSATLALAIAAHQAGRGELADRLARGGLGREHVALRRGGEPAFWLLATGAYGVLGRDAPSVSVVVDGQRHEVDLTPGRAVIALPAAAGGHTVRVDAPDGRGAVVRVEAAMERRFRGATGGPLRLELSGDVGDASTLAALELTVHAEREVSAPVLDISLPTGVEADESLLGSLRGASAVGRAEPREPGFVRVWLAPMAAGTEAVVPLPLRFGVRGSLTGLATVAYPEGDPGQMTVLPPRTLEIGAP